MHVPRGHAGLAIGGRAHYGVGTATCRVWHWRQGGAGFDIGGTCHVSPRQGCRHSQVVLFDKNFQRWSFLAFQWRRWSYVSKIPSFEDLVISSSTVKTESNLDKRFRVKIISNI
jgi:hypothetical protein